jgi:hypothetical protein
MGPTAFLLALSVLLPLVSAPAEAEPLFKIVDQQFSRLVLSDYKVVDPATDGKISRSALGQRKLYFSFTVVGDARTIQYLQENDQLEISAVIYAGGIHRGKVSLAISQDKWDEMKGNITSKFFTYRTKMYTRQIEYASVEINIRDGAGNTIARESVKIVP